MPDQDYVRLNAILVIPEEIETAAIDLSKKLGDENEALFILGREQCQPHITVYSPEYPKSAQEEVVAVVKRVATPMEPIRLHVVGASSGQGYIGLQVSLTPEIKQLHENLVAQLNPLRGGRVRGTYAPDYHLKFSDEQIKNIEAYGYHNAMSLYHPHLTLIRLQNEQRAKEIAQTLEWPHQDVIVKAIAVYEMGEHGTCQKLVREFSLKK